jgi:hypothetical protein
LERRVRRDAMAAQHTAIGDEAFRTLRRKLCHLETTMVEASRAG